MPPALDESSSSTSMIPIFRVFSSTEELKNSLGSYIADMADASIEARGTFLLATSGGSLPATLAASLCGVVASGRDLRTEAWVLIYVDERHVALDAPDSNHGATVSALAGVDWWRARIVPIEPALPLDACAAAYNRALAVELEKAGGAIDLVVLGMGPDGHTASLFPGHPLVSGDGSNALVAAIADSPKPPAARVTLTLSALRAAHNVAFVACGTDKALALAAVASTDAASHGPDALPAARVHARGKPAVFFTDTGGASMMAAAKKDTL